MADIKPEKLIMKAIVVSILGGVIAVALAMVLAPLEAMGWMVSLVIGFVLIVAMAYLQKDAKVDNYNWFQALMLFFAVALVGTAMTQFIPQIETYILSISEFTLSGLVWTVFYVMLAEKLIKAMKLG